MLLSDKVQLQHFVQASFPAFGVFFRITDGIVAGRILGDTGDDGRLGHGQFTCGFAEIPFGSGFHAQGILPQIDSVHIFQQDSIFIVIFGDFQGEILFLQLTFDLFDHVFTFGGPAGKDGILQQLLGNGAGALCLLTSGF